MRILTRYLARSIIGPFIFGVSTFTAIMVGFALINLAQRPFLSGETVLRLTALAVPENLALAFPMGILLGTLFALGQLSGHSEIIAMRAGGLSGARLILPFLVFGMLTSLASLALSEIAVPFTHRAYLRELARASGASASRVLRRQVLPPEFENGRLKRLVYVDEFDLEQLYLRGVSINEYTGGQLSTAVQADEMSWDGNAWRFQRGRIVFLNPDGRMARLTVRGGRTEYRPLLPKPKEITLAARDTQSMTWREFQTFIAGKARAGENVRPYQVELQTRLAIPFACLALAVVASPLGVQTRRSGSAISFGLAIAVLFVYFFLLSFAQVLGRTGFLPPAAAAWSANIVLFLVGFGLFVRRMR